MAVNPNWTRWIVASVATYLRQVATDGNLAVLIEGLDDRTPAFENATDRSEIRVSGPFSRELSHNDYSLLVDVNVLLTSRYDGNGKSRYTILTNAGRFHEAMQRDIPVYKFGDGPDDDPTVLLGCLKVINGQRADTGGVRVTHFGQVDTTNRLKQSIVDARYSMELQGDE
jgi:hypothetical protein